MVLIGGGPLRASARRLLGRTASSLRTWRRQHRPDLEREGGRRGGRSDGEGMLGGEERWLGMVGWREDGEGTPAFVFL